MISKNEKVHLALVLGRNFQDTNPGDLATRIGLTLINKLQSAGFEVGMIFTHMQHSLPHPEKHGQLLVVSIGDPVDDIAVVDKYRNHPNVFFMSVTAMLGNDAIFPASFNLTSIDAMDFEDLSVHQRKFTVLKVDGEETVVGSILTVSTPEDDDEVFSGLTITQGDEEIYSGCMNFCMVLFRDDSIILNVNEGGIDSNIRQYSFTQTGELKISCVEEVILEWSGDFTPEHLYGGDYPVCATISPIKHIADFIA